MPPSETEQCLQVCGFSSLGNLSGVNGVGMVDAAGLPFGFLGHQDIQAWGFHLLNSSYYKVCSYQQFTRGSRLHFQFLSLSG